MLKDDGIKFEPCFPVEEAGAMIRAIVERLQLPGLQDGFFVNVDEVAGKATVSVKKLDCWKNLVWEFRKRDTAEAQQVFGDYFVAATESGPFAEMIDAVSEKIREAAAVWMNKTAFDALRDEFIKQVDIELEKRLSVGKTSVSVIVQDISTVKSFVEKCVELKDRMSRF